MKNWPHAFAFVFFAVCLLAGCASTRDNLVRADVAFTQTVQAATQLRQQGDIGDDTAAKLTPVIDRGNQALDAAWIAIAQGQPHTAAGYLATINATLAQLIEIQQEVRDE